MRWERVLAPWARALPTTSNRAAAASTIAFSVGLVSGGLGVYLMLRDDRQASTTGTSAVPQHRRDAYAAVSGSW